jgi:hypothetical protein
LLSVSTFCSGFTSAIDGSGGGVDSP